MSWERFLEGFKTMGFERTRRTLAQLALVVFALLYIFLSLMIDPAWRPAFITLGFCYLVGFFAVGSEWFWARWFAMGLGWSGFMVGVFSMVNAGPVAPLVFYTILHGAMVASMQGQAVSKLYEGQTAWRERYGLDEYGVGRVGKAVTRTSASLPALVVWALGPKEPESLGLLGSGSGVIVGVAFALAVVGLVMLLKMRSAGMLAVAAAAGVCMLALLSGSGLSLLAWGGGQELIAMNAARWVASASLVFATVPFWAPIGRYLSDRR